jgi:hypothetical protein
MLGWSTAIAGHCDRCGKSCHEHHLVKKTIMVPVVVTETRLKTCVIQKTEEREETYTVFKPVTKTQKFEKEICYLADEVKRKTITQTECHRVQNPVNRVSSIKVPVDEYYQGTELRRVCDECGREVCVEVPCTCKKTRLEKDLQSDFYQVEDVVFEKTTKDIDYCVKTPKKHKELCAEETVCKLEPVVKKRKVQVCVPEIIKQPVEVKVTRMVPKTICCCEKCSHSH